MQHTIRLKDLDIAYELKKSRGRRLRITITPEERVIVSVPRFTTIGTAEAFLKKKEVWVVKTIERFRKRPKISPIEGSFPKDKQKALKLAEAKVEQWNKHYNAKITRVTVRDQKTRWGSASRKGSLSFNYRILYLPEHLADYLVVHEICHLRQMDHSPRFWRLVEETIPDYKAARKTLRAYGRFSS
jgi:predicted metal-dependent hydrolase